jgi:hypothetical protein
MFGSFLDAPQMGTGADFLLLGPFSQFLFDFRQQVLLLLRARLASAWSAWNWRPLGAYGPPQWGVSPGIEMSSVKLVYS